MNIQKGLEGLASLLNRMPMSPMELIGANCVLQALKEQNEWVERKKDVEALAKAKLDDPLKDEP